MLSAQVGDYLRHVALFTSEREARVLGVAAEGCARNGTAHGLALLILQDLLTLFKIALLLLLAPLLAAPAVGLLDHLEAFLTLLSVCRIVTHELLHGCRGKHKAN